MVVNLLLSSERRSDRRPVWTLPVRRFDCTSPRDPAQSILRYHAFRKICACILRAMASPSCEHMPASGMITPERHIHQLGNSPRVCGCEPGLGFVLRTATNSSRARHLLD